MKTANEYVSEIISYLCPYCRMDHSSQALLGRIESYRHPNGFSTSTPTEFGDILELRWWYGVCNRCQYQWSLVKLRDAYGFYDMIPAMIP